MLQRGPSRRAMLTWPMFAQICAAPFRNDLGIERLQARAILRNDHARESLGQLSVRASGQSPFLARNMSRTRPQSVAKSGPPLARFALNLVKMASAPDRSTSDQNWPNVVPNQCRPNFQQIWSMYHRIRPNSADSGAKLVDFGPQLANKAQR